MHSRPVRASVPTGTSRQAKVSAAAKAVTIQCGRNTVPWRVNHQISGTRPIATVASVELS
jgi:hypothetical protein